MEIPTKCNGRNEMNLDSAIASICEVIKQGKAALFIGSGVSIDPPSCLPPGEPLKNTPIEGLLASYRPSIKELVFENTIADLSLETVYGVMQEEIGKQLITSMATALDDDGLEANKLHRFIAKALSLSNVIVTTNYDGQIERAYSQEAQGEDLEICYDEETFKRFINNFEEGKGKWLLKLHGSFRVKGEDTSESVVTTLDRVGRGLPSKTKKALRLVLKRLHLLFLGYGCGDLDIVYPVLAQKKSEKEMWWIKHESERAGKSLYIGNEIKELSTELLHITTVLLNRGKNNGEKVFLIKYLTSEFIEMLITNLNWQLTQPKSEGLSKSHWKGELFCLGHQASQLEKASILANLTRLGRNTEGGREKLTQLNRLMQQLYKEAVGESKDPLKTSRLYRDLGFSLYLGSHEETKEAIKHYEKSKGLLSQIDPETKPLLEEAELLSLYALAYRRVYQIEKAREYAVQAREAIPKEILDQLDSSYQNLSSLKYRNKELDDKQKSNLGNILRRLANTYHDLVSDPTTLSIAIGIGKDSWKMADVENNLLEEAFQRISSDKKLQNMVGNVRERIQSENVLGLIATKRGKVDKAKQVHEQRKKDASLLNWTSWEYAQACRNLGLALEKEGNLDLAIERLEEAREKFRRTGDKETTNWHIGRIRIKKGDARGIFVIEEIKRGPKNWHWKANDLVLLGIGYHDLLKNKEEEARSFFEQMLELYEAIEPIELKSQAYGIDNALANVKSAHLRLCSEGTHKEDDLCKRLQDQQARLEKMREEALKVIASFFSQS